jgi:hypothetical protein
VPTPITNDFKKAMSSIVLTASASLAEAQRLTSKMGSFNRRKADQTHGLAVEFCRLLIEPVNEHGPGFAAIPGFAETYCRKHLISATNYLTRAMATHNQSSPECKRLLRVAGLIEQNLKVNLDAETAKLCWFGDEGDTVVRELEKHSFGNPFVFALCQQRKTQHHHRSAGRRDFLLKLQDRQP